MTKYNLSKEGMKHLELSEGMRLKAYLAPEGKWTIGLGCTYIPRGFGYYVRGEYVLVSKDTPVQRGMSLRSREEATKMSKHLIDRTYGKVVNDLVRVKINQHMFDALVNLTYNIGTKGFTKSSVLKHLNSKNYERACVEFVSWNKHYSPSQGKLDNSDGLINRRKNEMALFIKGFNEYINKSDGSKTRGFWSSIFG